MTEVSVTLPYPPSANRMWRSVPGMAQPIKSREYRNWQAKADAAIPTLMRGMIRGAHSVVIDVDRPDRRKRDLDNLIKPTLDAIKDHPAKSMKGVVRDDADMVSLTIRWSGPDPVENPTIRITARAQ